MIYCSYMWLNFSKIQWILWCFSNVLSFKTFIFYIYNFPFHWHGGGGGVEEAGGENSDTEDMSSDQSEDLTPMKAGIFQGPGLFQLLRTLAVIKIEMAAHKYKIRYNINFLKLANAFLAIFNPPL